MRYYSIQITNPNDGSLISAPGFAGLLGNQTYGSFVNGRTIPAAWNVELDIPVIDAATSQGFATATVWGISVAEIGQANNLVGKNIAIYGGMQKGLPLANPAQSGLLVSGWIYQCFGNWIGTDMTLDFVIAPGQATSTNSGGFGTLASPKNITLNWPKNTPLSTALKNCLQTAFPGYTVNISISANLVRPNDEIGPFPTLEQLAQYCLETSLSIIKTSGYLGVSIVPQGKTINVFDYSTAPANTVQLAFQDLIGQPTWLEGASISIKTVMRADLNVGSAITLPPALITTTAASPSSLVNLKAAFAGGFGVQSLRHVGNFRQPSADMWVSVIEGAPYPAALLPGPLVQ